MNAAELILNPDGSIYHLHLLPDEIAPVVILVGDPGRVEKISRHFDVLDIQRQKREFVTHTGSIGNQRLTALSTGIGTDNIDIVLNELDALVNIDLATRQIKPVHSSLLLIRAGTSGSIHPDIGVDQLVVSAGAVGTDILGSYYGAGMAGVPGLPPWAYRTAAQGIDPDTFPPDFHKGITLTCAGFYGPQGRQLRLAPTLAPALDKLYLESLDGYPFTNLEMETAGIYLLAEKLGHRAISVNTILAQRREGVFSPDPAAAVDHMIVRVLEWISRHA